MAGNVQYQVLKRGLSYPVHIHTQFILLMLFNEIVEVLPTKDQRTTVQRARVRTSEKEITQERLHTIFPSRNQTSDGH
jgi:hypothetical protein